MAIGPERNEKADEQAPFPASGIWEVMGIVVLGLLAAYFLHLSWRKWPDPIVDVGPQWYAFWRTSQGAIPYHDFLWNYGPLSVLADGLMFRCFGPGMMVLVTANLIVWGLIGALAYLALRKAWGWLAAWAALAVFISIFSFSTFNKVENYNFATPYAQEATHGLLLMLVTLFAVVRWSRGASRTMAFALGCCGGLAAVLKPEFMLAGAVLGMGGLFLRHRQGLRVGLGEFGLLLTGLVLPTLGFAAWFARVEAWPAAFIDASQAWLVVVKPRTAEMLTAQPAFLGLDHPWTNIRLEVIAALDAVAVLGAIWVAGWSVNRQRPRVLKWVVAAAAVALAFVVHLDKGWFHVGQCLPGLMLMGLVLVAFDLRREERRSVLWSEQSCIALLLVLLGGAMMARMFLQARVFHFGFFQGAIAGMVAVAMMVAKIPGWTGTRMLGRWLALLSILTICGLACSSLAARSGQHRADQAQPVGSGADLFYAVTPDFDETGFLVNWSLAQLRSIPPDANLLVLPEGFMINFLSRHRSPKMPELQASAEGEDNYLRSLAQTRPDYIIWLTRDMSESGISKYGDAGKPGAKLLGWIEENYAVIGAQPGRDKNANLLKRKENGQPASR
jgi:hypothetical protein